MAHRENRDRGTTREWDRPEREDRTRRERDPREPNRDRERERDRDAPRGGLNEFFVNGEGINREVMQREICKYLGPEAYSRPGNYNGVSGYFVTAVRPFTPKMIDDLQLLSREFISENRDLSRRGYEGVSYQQSHTSRQFDRTRQDESMMSPPEMYNDSRYSQSQLPYSSSGAQPQPGYMSTVSYSPGTNYQQLSGYESGPAYPQAGGYQVGPNYPQVTGYSAAPVYPTATGYAQVPYAASVGRPGNDQLYTTHPAPGEYPYRQNPFPSGTRPGEPIADPRFQQLVTSQGDSSIRAPAYDLYNQSMASGQPPRGAFAPPRGAQTGYEGQPPDRSHKNDDGRRRN